jgi:hypothetical protein
MQCISKYPCNIYTPYIIFVYKITNQGKGKFQMAYENFNEYDEDEDRYEEEMIATRCRGLCGEVAACNRRNGRKSEALSGKPKTST